MKEVSELKEGWQKENLEKTKEVLTEHFKRKKEEEIFKEMFREVNLSSRYTQLHIGTDWEIDDSEFTDFTEELIWGIPIEKKSVFNKIKDVFSNSYWGLRYNLWLIKHIITKKLRK